MSGFVVFDVESIEKPRFVVPAQPLSGFYVYGDTVLAAAGMAGLFGAQVTCLGKYKQKQAA